MSITLNNFCKQFANQSKEAQDFLENTAPRLAGAIAIKHAEENFQREGLGGRPWKEVQRRKPGTAAYRSNAKHHPARLTRKILTGDTGDLGRSLQAEYGKGTVTIFSDKIYAKVHNEGLHAGRGAGFTMPKRQFLSDGKMLTDIVKETIAGEYNKIFSK